MSMLSAQSLAAAPLVALTIARPASWHCAAITIPVQTVTRMITWNAIISSL
jgi:hypothetical protein